MGVLASCADDGGGGAATRRSECLAAQFSTTLATAVDTGLELAVGAGEVVFVNVYATVDAPAGGMKFALDCPTGSTIEGWIVTTQASLITTLTERVVAIDTLTASMAATLRGTCEMLLRVVVGDAGTIKLQACSTTATQTTIVDAGATLEIVDGVVAV